MRKGNSTNGQTDLRGLAEALRASDEVGVWVAIDRKSEPARVRRLSINARPDLDCPQRRWSYDVLELISGVVSGRVAAGWFHESRKAAALNGRRFALPEFQSSVSWRWNPSHSPLGVVLWPMPYMEYEVAWPAPQGAVWSQLGPLVNPNAPGYLDAEEAVSEFFDAVASSPRTSTPVDRAHVRLGCTAGWLDDVLIAPTVVSIAVRGDAIAGSRLELNSPRSKAEEALSEPGVVKFAVPDGLPEKSWVVLSQGGHVIDSRHLGPPWGSNGITVEPPPLADQLAVIIPAGEGLTAEFKVQLPASKGERHKLARTVAAFANGVGGVLVYGVDDDTLTPVHLDVSQGHLDNLHHVLRDLLHPQPVFAIEKVQVAGSTIVAVVVDKGSEPPYGIPDRDGFDVYVRRGPHTVPARREEIVSLSAPAMVSSPFGLR